MARACVIVLDAVGAGRAARRGRFGDEGSDTLGNVAKAVGGLDLPTLEALGLGNVEPLEGCPPQPGAPAVAGRLLERSRGKDTTTGHWEMMGIVTPAAMPTLPARLPGRGDRPVHEPDGPRRARERARERHGDHPGARRGAPADRQVDRLHERRLGLPDRRARGDDPARGALRGLPRRARDPHRQARGRPRDRAARSSASPATTSARRTATTSRSSRRGRTTCRCSGPRARRSTASGRSPTSSPAATSTSRSRRSRTSRGSSARRSSCARSTTASSSRTSSRRTCSGGTATTPRTSTAASRTSTAACRTCSTRSAKAICWSSPRITAATRRPRRPTTRASTRLLLAYVQGRNAAGRVHEGGEFADVGATVNAWLGGQAPSRGLPGKPILDP